jgi:hypothetical protein
MLTTVNFYDDPALQADEINNVRAYGTLSAKFVTADLTKVQLTPQ